jgi:hypothetical protein
LTPVKFSARFKQPGTGCTVYCTVNPAAAQQRVIGGIHNRFHIQPGNIADNGFHCFRLFHSHPSAHNLLFYCSHEFKQLFRRKTNAAFEY